MQILIVDDDALAGELVAALLEDLGHACALAGDGIEALERVAADARIELVVSDLHMPLISGLELFLELRERGHMLPFILLTGDDPEPIAAGTRGLYAVLMKDAALEERLPALIAGLAAELAAGPLAAPVAGSAAPGAAGPGD